MFRVLTLVRFHMSSSKGPYDVFRSGPNPVPSSWSTTHYKSLHMGAQRQKAHDPLRVPKKKQKGGGGVEFSFLSRSGTR